MPLKKSITVKKRCYKGKITLIYTTIHKLFCASKPIRVKTPKPEYNFKQGCEAGPAAEAGAGAWSGKKV